MLSYIFYFCYLPFYFLLFLLEKCNRKLIIKDRIDDEDYLERYYLFLRNRKTFPFNIFLHKFLKSDSEDLHDHPWDFTTIILTGGYWEYTPNNKRWYGPGSIIKKKASDYHRIELDPTKTTWTLFIPGKQKQDWGFKVGNDWIHHEKYLRDKILNK